MFQLVIGKCVLRGLAGNDNKLYFRGLDAALILGYRSQHFFVNNHCEKMLKEIIKQVKVIFDQKRLNEFYIEYFEMFKKRRDVPDYYSEWTTFKELFFSVKVSVSQLSLQSEPVARVTEDGEVFFRDWFYYNYFTPIYPLTLPQPPQLLPAPSNSPASLTSPQPPQLLPAPSNSPASVTTPQPPQLLPAPSNSPASLTSPQPPQFEPHSPLSPPPNSPVSSPQPIDYSTRDPQRVAAKTPELPTTAAGNCYIFMDSYPPNTVRMCFGGQVYEFVRK